MDLGSVRVKIEGDSTKLQADLKTAEAAAANAGGKIAQAFNKSAGSINDTTAATKKAVSGITQTGEAAEKAGQKVQSFVGAIPGMGVAAERFIGLIPGLGAGLMAIFPVLGAIAFAEGLGRVATSIGNAIDEAIGLKKAMEQLADATKAADSAIASLGKTVDSINVDRMTEKFGKESGLKLKAGLGAAEAQADFVKARELYASIERLKKEFELNNAVNPGVLIPGVRGDIYAQQKATLDKLEQNAIAAQASGKERLLRAQKDLDDAGQEKVKAGKEALKKDNEGWENRYRLFETELAETKAIRDSQLKATADFNQKMLDLSERGQKDYDESRIKKTPKEERFRQAEFDEPLGKRIAKPLAAAMDLNKAGVFTTNQRERDIALDQELLTLAQSINVPLGTQLKMREQILQKQIDLKAAQGQSVSAELQALDALQAQMDQMRQKAAGIAPMLHNLRGIGGTIPGQLGGALAGGIMSGNPGKAIGQEIRGALQGIGKQLLGTVFQELINTILVQTGVQAALTAAISANTVAVIGSTAAKAAGAIGGLIKGVVKMIPGVGALASMIGLADGGRPPLGRPSIVGERGPEMFIPDQAGRIVPNHQMAGGAGLMLPMMAAIASNSVGSMNFHAHGMTNPREFVREVARQLPAYLKSTNPKYSPASR